MCNFIIDLYANANDTNTKDSSLNTGSDWVRILEVKNWGVISLHYAGSDTTSVSVKIISFFGQHISKLDIAVCRYFTHVFCFLY